MTGLCHCIYICIIQKYNIPLLVPFDTLVPSSRVETVPAFPAILSRTFVAVGNWANQALPEHEKTF
jgi:hypothetical protein